MTTIVQDNALQQAQRYHEKKQWDKAGEAYKKILKKDPHHALALSGLGFLLHQQGQSQTGLPYLKKARMLQPKNSNIAFNYAIVCALSGLYAEAVAAFVQVVQAHPKDATVWSHLATCQHQLFLYEDAKHSIDKALALDSCQWKYLLFKAKLMEKMENRQEAHDLFHRLILMNPCYETYLASGDFFRKHVFSYNEAIACYAKAREFQPKHLLATMSLLECLRASDNLVKVKAGIDKALQWHPNDPQIRLFSIQYHHDTCNWQDKETEDKWVHELLQQELKQDKPLSLSNFSSFSFLWPDSFRRQMAEHRAQERNNKISIILERNLFVHTKKNKAKLRIAYISPDFRNHATGHLMRDSFRYHNRDRFEVFAYSYGVTDNTGVAEAIASGVDKFVRLERGTLQNWAERIYNDNIDILIDLVGLLMNAKLEIYHMKPAPIQVSYMAYPGTTGIPTMDYYIADAFALPITAEEAWSETIIRLPDTYWLRSDSEPIAPLTTTRQQEKLPEDVIVFAAFNGLYKIDPIIFKVWMEILQAVPNSVLWIVSKDNAVLAQQNLIREASIYGITENRFVFANSVSKAEHLARHVLADLALDTYIVNGHTTTSDALWTGLPVLTCPGETFISRVAGSILHAADLSECVLPTLSAYRDRAIALAKDRAQLQQLKQKVQQVRNTAPLFNTKLRIQQLEAAYETMWAKYLEE
jgi:protein O-GlcNAc transferase